MDELESERCWSRSFETSQDQLADLAREAIEEDLAGRTEPLDPKQRRCCMKALRGWGGVARTSLDPLQEPHYRDEVEGPSPVQDKVPRCELGGLQPRTRSTRRCDGVVVRGGDRCLDARPERPAGWAAGRLFGFGSLFLSPGRIRKIAI